MPNERVTPTPLSSRIVAAIPWIVWTGALFEAGLIGSAPLQFSQLFATSTERENIEFGAFLGTVAFVVMVFATAGLFIIRQQPRDAVGWLMLAGGPALGASLAEAGSGVGGWFVLVGVVLFGPALYLLGPALAVVFPNGRPPPGRGTSAFGFCTALIIIGTLMVTFTPGPLEEGIPVTNPLGIGALPSALGDVGDALTALALVGGSLVAVASLVIRYRHASSELRHQLKWFLYAGVVWAAVIPVGLVVGETSTAIVVLLALGLVPVAVVVAVLRYRLYEIDTLINRTLVYVPLVGVVAGLYAGMVALFQRLFTAVTGDTSDAAAVISALALATVFTPIRNTIQLAVDRRFKPEVPKPASQWDDPEFRVAVEAIVRDVTGRPR